MVNRLVSVGDDFTLPTAVKVADTNLPARLGTTALNATFGPDAQAASAPLKAAFAGNPLPSYAGTGRTKTFNSNRSIYNGESKNLGLIRARVANGSIAGGGTCQILGQGHSYMAGSQTTPGVNDVFASVQKILGARTGGTVRAGISVFRNGEIRDSHYSAISAGWGTSNGATLTFYATSTTSGDAVTYTSTDAGTIVTIFVTNDSGGFSYTIDGGSAVAVTPLDSVTDPLKVRRIVIGGLPNTTHTVVLTKTSTTTTSLVGVGVTGTNGVEIFNFGYGGSYSSQWISLASGEKRAVTTSCATQRDVVLIEIDTNDARPGGANLSGPAWKASIGQVISSHVGLGHPTAIILSVDAPDVGGNVVPAGRWDEYAVAAYQLAEQYDVPLLDTRHLLGGWTAAGLSTFTGADSIHLNTRGYYQMSQGIAGLLVR